MISLTDVLALPVAERVALVGRIWDTIADSAEGPPLSAAQRRALLKRLDAYHRDDNPGATWPDVRARFERCG
jgi:putative addiction module component (TIGR02574 family)